MDSPFQSALADFLGEHTDVLDRLVAERYARGLSTRDIEDALTDATGNAASEQDVPLAT